MKYVSAKFPETLSVKGIYSVFRRDFSASVRLTNVDIHNFPEIVYVRSGTIYPLVDKDVYTVTAGQLIIYAPNSAHSASKSCDASVSIISFDIDSDALASLYNTPITLSKEEEQMLESVVEDGCRCFEKRPSGTDARGFVLRDDADEGILRRMQKGMEFVLVELLKGREERERAEKSKEYECVRTYLRTKIYTTLTVEEIAEGSKMSVSKLKYLFRENTGGGVINCFIEMKIEEAKRLITESGYNFSEIADRLAFNSLHYFSRTFKRIVGVSPSEYSKKCGIKK